MLFNSLSFVIFLAVQLFLYNLPFSWRVKKINLLWGSYIFYAAWNPPFVALLWFSTVLDWFAAKWLYATESRTKRRALLVVSLGANLALLGFFKYGRFLLDNFVALMGLLGVPFHPATPDIILPVGISFYTFQTMSYTIDVYLGKTPPAKSFLSYALYVTFFAQLVAGPIVRSEDFLPQCDGPRKVTARHLGWGFSLLILGLFEKMVLADTLLAPLAERVYDATASPTLGDGWCATLAFAGQIFCDFAGYSTCALGLALCFGFVLMQNFRFPYAALGPSDFWRRWHISLSTWLRDYLYVPLGGNRHGALLTCRNLALTMLLGGLWHGASWTFVVWGALHGFYLVAERAVRGLVPPSRLWGRWPVRLALAVLTFLLVCVGWVFFRARTFGRAFAILGSMLGFAQPAAPGLIPLPKVAGVAAFTAVLLGVHWLLRDSSIERAAMRLPWWARSLVLALLMIAIVTMTGEDRAFIYFQF